MPFLKNSPGPSSQAKLLSLQNPENGSPGELGPNAGVFVDPEFRLVSEGNIHIFSSIFKNYNK